jgi:fused signal recognition particle receptor
VTNWVDRLAATTGMQPEVLIGAAAGLAVLLAVLLVVVAIRLRRRRVPQRQRASPGGALAEAPAEPASARERLEHGLGKTRRGLLARLSPLLGRRDLDEAALEELETALLSADVGVTMTQRLLADLRRAPRDGQSLGEVLQASLVAILEKAAPSGVEATERPRIIMVLGVNGAGKTTSIGKLACRFAAEGRRVMLIAGDTFRAAAADQLGIWAERAGAEIVRQQPGGDPGAVVYDGLQAARARGIDVVLVDTAGRLHTKTNLMEELRKIRRIIAREIPGAPHETLLVLDAVTGQNGIAQARAFVRDLGADGVVLTKLDGTAKGGVVVAVAGELGVPVRFVGVGEGVDDLRDFDAREFVAALFGAPSP